MIIIGITGTLGAGKGAVVDYLVNEKGFVHYSVRAFITEEIKKQSMPVNRDSMVLVANKLRTEHSPSYIIEKLYEQALFKEENCIIESIRTQGEVEALKNKGNFYLFAVDANVNLRYERIINRNSETDKVSFETFIENENREMQSTDNNKQNISKCIEMADYIFTNNGTISELKVQVDKALVFILKNY